MKLKELLNLDLNKIPSLTIGTVNGQGWLCYYDGTSWYGNNREDYYDREVKELWFRMGRKNRKDVYGNEILPLEKGIAIIITGNEHGEV